MEENRIQPSQQLERVEYTQLLPPDLQVDGKVHKVEIFTIVVVMLVIRNENESEKPKILFVGLQLHCFGLGRRDSLPHRLKHQIRPQRWRF